MSGKSTESAEPSQAPEKLVLTPAQRVDSAAAEPPAQEPADPVGDNILVLDPGKRADRVGLEATIAELEAAVADSSDDPEAADADTDNAFAMVADPVPAVDTSDEQDPEDVAESSDDDDTPIGALTADDALSEGLDENALRELVVQIVREELSGEMGERITRNVRKLVRREINRILASRELG